jgi:hypothetical protein
MPTPFTHLEIAQRLLVDDAIPPEILAQLNDERSAFLLGSIAADARVSSGLKREDTHFYAYGETITEPPWRTMMRRFPTLERAKSAAQRTFLAAYVAHLSVDAVWTIEMTDPHFAHSDWADQRERFIVLHMLLVTMDERDYPRLCDWQRETLLDATPDDWLPFMTNADLTAWRDLVGTQLPPGVPTTLEILGGRLGMAPQDLQALVDSKEAMETRLWAHIPPALWSEVEAHMVADARAQMLRYWSEYGG